MQGLGKGGALSLVLIVKATAEEVHRVLFLAVPSHVGLSLVICMQHEEAHFSVFAERVRPHWFWSGMI